MTFFDTAKQRQSCRNFDANKPVEQEKISQILECANLAPSACNSQPYYITVCKKDAASAVAKATMGMGMNKFAAKAPIMLVISEAPYNKTAALGAKMKNNDYRSIDIGILTAHIVLASTELGLSTCILGWLDDKKIREICSLEHPVRLVIALGYAAPDDALRPKKRKTMSDISKITEEI